MDPLGSTSAMASSSSINHLIQYYQRVRSSAVCITGSQIDLYLIGNPYITYIYIM